MRVLVVYAHPSETSFCAALRDRAVASLRARGHDVDPCDLYAEGFDPVMTRRDHADYHKVGVNRAAVQSYVDRLLGAQGLVIVFPVWNEGFPAILKGFFDRVFLPGVTFDEEPGGKLAPRLGNINKLAAVCTYGAGRVATFLLGDPPRRVVKRLLRALPGHSVRCDYLACYDMNANSNERRTAFIAEVGRTFGSW